MTCKAKAGGMPPAGVGLTFAYLLSALCLYGFHAD